MIFNVNAAAVAALALTMAVHAAPSPVVGLSILPDCDNDRTASRADESNRISNESRRIESNHASDSFRQTASDDSPLIDVSANSRPAGSNRSSEESRPAGSNRSSEESRPANSNHSSEESRPAGSNHSSEESRPAGSNHSSEESRPAGSNRSSEESRPANSNYSSEESRPAGSNHSSEESRRPASDRSALVDVDVNDATSRHTDSNRASGRVVDAHIQTTHHNVDQSHIIDDDDARNRDTRDNSRCDDCTSELSLSRMTLQRGLGVFSGAEHVLRVEYLSRRCSPEEAASRCGDDCNGIVGGWDYDLSTFCVYFLSEHSITPELDAKLSETREKGMVQYHYDQC
ncbi:hypothetical protein IW261DRAFT_364618 [Armillaria novae-zelandiae]|uniref:Uncharacterized protein n=1 Tax=Armillaria novae-zelandiae TaxID=153914 RepID=A0AA39PRE8_9AGAR|nr:hypothetical protein IW261DRAFT_364618 [Armillaria novae-zelandiae]